jgi:hypothetical protein
MVLAMDRWAQAVKATCVSIEMARSRRACGAVVGFGAGRIEGLLSEDAPFWRLRQEVPRSRYAIYRAVTRLRRPPAPEPNRSPLRLSLADREEISRGVAAGESLRVIAGRLGRVRPQHRPDPDVATEQQIAFRA